MASFHTLSTFGSHGGHKSKISKPRSKAAVKPILRKLAPSEKSSLDLDRGWEDQDDQFRSNIQAGSPLGYNFEPSTSPQERTLFSEVGVTAGNRRYNHSRSISGTSHISVATSNSSNGAPRQAGATFVHPFQQTPRTATPPLSLSYANSLASIADNRDYSPTTITEDEDCENLDPTESHNSLFIHQSNRHQQQQQHQLANASHSLSQPSLNLRRPSLASRTSSYTDISNVQPPPPLRINTTRSISSSTPAQSSRLANVSSRSDLYLDRTLDSPTSPTNIGNNNSSSHNTNSTTNNVASPSSSVTPLSPLRNSMDASGFPRLRAKSDLDTATRAEHLRAARRKFEMKERAKDEKYAREQIKRRERAENKRAHEREKAAAAAHKEQRTTRAHVETAELEEAMAARKHARKHSVASSGRPSLAMSRPSLSMSMTRPGTSRQNTGAMVTGPTLGDMERFSSRNYDNTNPRSPPAFGNEAGGAQDVRFQSAKRKNTAKKKTQSTWTMFVLWLRTKLLRMGNKR
ncbi:hypothetical protein F5Y15DRAFT_296968 [Xylariaceae sp. FL0016]|nr:hypothetical protein F5Y15DRAFT_296968 [Xylariaceae sp. FL0016]